RKQRRYLTATFSASTRGKCQRLPVQLRLSHQQPRRDGHAHPPILQHIHREVCPSSSDFAVAPQIVINSRQRGIYARRFSLVLSRVSPRMQVAIFVNRKHDPSGRMRRFLGNGSYWERTDRNGAEQEQPQPVLQENEGQEKRQPRSCHISSTREKGNETEVYGNAPPEKIACAAYCPITSVGCPDERQARIVARGKTSEDRRTLIERTWLCR